MARFLACCCVLVLLDHVVAPPPPIIEAYKPTTGLTTRYQDMNSGFGSLEKLSKMLTKLEHQINDINVRRKIMEEQMKSPFHSTPNRMEAAIDFTDTSTPSTVYTRKIVSANGVFLQIFEDGTANGTRDDTSPYTNLTVEMVGVGDNNHKRSKGVSLKMLIMGTKSKMYLACKAKNGIFYGSKNSQVFLSYAPEKPKCPKDDKFTKRHCILWPTKQFVNLECTTLKNGWLLGFRNNNKLKKGRHSRGNQLDSWFMMI